MIILEDDDNKTTTTATNDILPFFLPSLRLLYEVVVHNNKNASIGEWMIILEDNKTTATTTIPSFLLAFFATSLRSKSTQQQECIDRRMDDYFGR
jgi:hypothetical protein